MVSTMLLVLLPACATLSGNDPGARTPGAIIDDQGIESLARREIRNADPKLKAGHIEVVSFNGIVLLAGRVENEALKQRAGEVVQSLRKVRKVHNEIEVGGPPSMVARSNDAWLTTKVKTRLVASSAVDADRVKVVTEGAVVYLMGMVPREEGEAAVDAARSVFGVQKIVKVFEYVEAPPPKPQTAAATTADTHRRTGAPSPR